MSCDRCAGLMVRDVLIDLESSTSVLDTVAWRCLSCGRVRDPLIDQRRTAELPRIRVQRGKYRQRS